VAVVVVTAVVWMSEGVVCSNYHEQKPGDDGEDLVNNEVVARELFAFRKWIVCKVGQPCSRLPATCSTAEVRKEALQFAMFMGCGQGLQVQAAILFKVSSSRDPRGGLKVQCVEMAVGE
jgi:hypothetical protein